MNDSMKPLILIADDDAACLDVLVKMIEILGYSVVAVSNGKEAIEAYSSMKNKIDLVILDMKMPFNLYGSNSPQLAAIKSTQTS